MLGGVDVEQSLLDRLDDTAIKHQVATVAVRTPLLGVEPVLAILEFR